MHVVVGVGWERILCFTIPPARQADNMQVHIHMTYPLLVLESAPITTPPLYSTAMMEVLGGGRGKESELLATTMHTTNQVLVLVEGWSSLLQPGISIALHGQTHLHVARPHFCAKEKGLGHGHTAICRLAALWNLYQSQWSV